LLTTKDSLRHYANEVLQIDEFWFVNTYKTAPRNLPEPKEALTGASVVPWRYNLNTGEFCGICCTWEGQLD
jgi:hypothetical protein